MRLVRAKKQDDVRVSQDIQRIKVWNALRRFDNQIADAGGLGERSKAVSRGIVGVIAGAHEIESELFAKLGRSSAQFSERREQNARRHRRSWQKRPDIAEIYGAGIERPPLIPAWPRP